MKTNTSRNHKITLDPKQRQHFKHSAEEQGQVIVHCTFKNHQQTATAIRIWPSTFLLCNQSEHVSELVTSDLPEFPGWLRIYKYMGVKFTLVFSGLPKHCKTFDLEEHCGNQGGEFVVRSIPRNSTDVYHIELD